MFIIAVFWTMLTISSCQAAVLPRPPYNNMNGPLCASNFETYASRVSFSQAQKRQRSLVVVHTGKCKRTCTLYIPVCGSDSKTYHNICHLNYAREKNIRLYFRYAGQCWNAQPQTLVGSHFFNTKINDPTTNFYDWNSDESHKQCSLTRNLNWYLFINYASANLFLVYWKSAD